MSGMAKWERKRWYRRIGWVSLAVAVTLLTVAIWAWSEQWALQGGIFMFAAFIFAAAGEEA